jgi:hypothetical protein
MVSGTTSGLVVTCNQIYLKLKLGASECMAGIKNLNLNFFLIFFLISTDRSGKKKFKTIFFFFTSVSKSHRYEHENMICSDFCILIVLSRHNRQMTH